jgi:hypothetical protein
MPFKSQKQRAFLFSQKPEIAKEIEGENKFGKMCAELKPWVIDLECLAA